MHTPEQFTTAQELLRPSDLAWQALAAADERHAAAQQAESPVEKKAALAEHAMFCAMAAPVIAADERFWQQQPEETQQAPDPHAPVEIGEIQAFAATFGLGVEGLRAARTLWNSDRGGRSRASYLTLTEQWQVDQRSKPRGLGSQALLIVRAFCGDEASLKTLSQIQAERDKANPSNLPYEELMFDSVEMGDATHRLVTRSAVARFAITQGETHLKLRPIFEEAGSIMAKRTDPTFTAPLITTDTLTQLSDDLFHLGTKYTVSEGREQNWGFSPSLFRQIPEILGAPGPEGRAPITGYTARSAKLLGSYIAALERTA